MSNRNMAVESWYLGNGVGWAIFFERMGGCEGRQDYRITGFERCTGGLNVQWITAELIGQEAQKRGEDRITGLNGARVG